MSQICDCNVGIQNTGAPNCTPIADIAKKLIFVQTYASDGTRNSIAVSDTIDETYVLAKLNNADSTKKWYPTLPLNSVTMPKADPTTEDIDGIAKITADGLRSFNAVITGADTVYYSAIDSAKCGDVSVYIVDGSNQIIGEISEDGTELYPLAISSNTYNANYQFPEVGVAGKATIAFTFSELLYDGNIRLLKPEYNFLGKNFKGNLTINATVSGATLTGFTAVLKTGFGHVNNLNVVSGLLLADFALYNETTAAAVVISSVTENPDGTYTFVIPTQSNDDILTLTDTVNGYDLEVTVTMPSA